MSLISLAIDPEVDPPQVITTVRSVMLLYEANAENLLALVVNGIPILADGMPKANVLRTTVSSYILTTVGRSSTYLLLLRRLSPRLNPKPKARPKLKGKPKQRRASVFHNHWARPRAQRCRWNSEASETCKSSRVAKLSVLCKLQLRFAACCAGPIRQERHQAVPLPTESTIPLQHLLAAK